jgi:hypothetical protein
MTGVFVDENGVQLTQTQGPIQLSGEETWLFGAIGSGVYKMCQVYPNGTVIACASMNSTLDLTENNWNSAGADGPYTVANTTHTAGNTCEYYSS